MSEEIMKKKELLPIGSVVLLKNATKRVMITGYLSVKDGEEEIIYDYNGCMYPEGFLSSDQSCLFNHDQIEKVFSKGFIDEEATEFMKNLEQLSLDLQEKKDNIDTLEE